MQTLPWERPRETTESVRSMTPRRSTAGTRRRPSRRTSPPCRTRHQRAAAGRRGRLTVRTSVRLRLPPPGGTPYVASPCGRRPHAVQSPDPRVTRRPRGDRPGRRRRRRRRRPVRPAPGHLGPGPAGKDGASQGRHGRQRRYRVAQRPLRRPRFAGRERHGAGFRAVAAHERRLRPHLGERRRSQGRVAGLRRRPGGRPEQGRAHRVGLRLRAEHRQEVRRDGQGAGGGCRLRRPRRCW